MSLKVTFELVDADLKHFRRIMREAREVAQKLSAEEIISATESLLSDVRSARIPEFILDRLERVRTLISMLRDDEWNLPEPERGRVLNALAYFCEPEDIIPDQVPGLGFLDDAIMVELLVRELRHEIEAYQDFCKARAARDAGAEDGRSRAEWLEARRQALQSRMRNRRRRERERRRGGSQGRSPFSLY